MSYFGKYRGQVVNNIDPLTQGRLQVKVPAVLGDGQLSWALPCVPYAGSQVGLYLIPPVGANIWVEFEGGDPNTPIWTGCFWGTGELPGTGLPQVKLLKTDAITLTLSDLPGAGGFTLEVGPSAVPVQLKVAMDASGIALSNGASSVKLTAASVSINDGAMEVV
jgi:hypothetical protein